MARHAISDGYFSIGNLFLLNSYEKRETACTLDRCPDKWENNRQDIQKSSKITQQGGFQAEGKFAVLNR